MERTESLEDPEMSNGSKSGFYVLRIGERLTLTNFFFASSTLSGHKPGLQARSPVGGV